MSRYQTSQGHKAELEGTSSSNIYFKLASSKIKDDVVCLTRTSRYQTSQGHKAELEGTSSSNICFKLASSKIKDDSS